MKKRAYTKEGKKFNLSKKDARNFPRNHARPKIAFVKKKFVGDSGKLLFSNKDMLVLVSYCTLSISKVRE
jgi:hypothetical protein